MIEKFSMDVIFFDFEILDILFTTYNITESERKRRLTVKF